MSKRSYNSIKNYIEVESNSGCKLLTQENQYVNTDSYIDVQCKCGNPFSVTFDRFRTKNQIRCRKCSWEIKKKQYVYNDYTKEDFIKIVQQRANELNKSPRQEDFGKKFNLPSASSIISKLGVTKWNEVLQLCNAGNTKEKYYDKNKALKKLKDYINDLGYIPTKDELEKIPFVPSMSWYCKTFGSYKDTLNLIGFTSIITDEELLNILRNFYNKNGKSPCTKDMCNSNGLSSPEMYYRRFKTQSWNKILNMAGLDLNHYMGYTKEYALQKLKEYAHILGRRPIKSDFKRNNWQPSEHYYDDNFGGIINACVAAGIIDQPLTDEERIEISINELTKLARKLDRCPTVNEYESNYHKGFQRRVLENKLGLKYNDICRKYIPQYQLNQDNDITKDKILSDIKNMLNENNGAMTFQNMKKLGLPYSYNIFESKCNMTFNEIISYLGYTPIGTTTLMRDEETLLNDFYDMFCKIERIPTPSDINDNKNIASWNTYQKYFNNAQNICNLLNIEYDITNNYLGVGKVYLDKENNICRSYAEMIISNYFIDNGIKFEKETSYAELFGYGRKRFDWKLYIGNNVYYVEYFGMYGDSKNKAIRKYRNRTRKKIKDLYKSQYFNNCIFIFPNDIKNKTLDEIFNKLNNYSIAS